MSARAIAVCLVVVTLPFTAIGVRVGAQAVGPLWEWFEMRRWPEVPAEVLSVDVDVHELNDGTLYRVRAKYRYAFDGMDYEGSRVSLLDEPDSIGNFHQMTAARLRAAREAGVAVPCFVNPQRPQEAILIREPRWGATVFLLVFAVSFAGPGILFAAGAIYIWRDPRRVVRLRQLVTPRMFSTASAREETEQADRR